jgi:superfamily II DNA helicase RecQ
VFCVRPCLWQLEIAEAIQKREKDVVCIVGDGTEETLAFWMPLLFRPDGIQIVVTPLTLLGKQNTTLLAKAGIRAVSISWDTARLANFHVSFSNDLV